MDYNRDDNINNGRSDRMDSKERESVRRFRRLWGMIFTLLLTAYAAWTLLDAFVIPQDIVSGGDSPAQEESAREASAQAEGGAQAVQAEDAAKDRLAEETAGDSYADRFTSAPVITDHSYSDDRISIEISTARELDTDIYVADVVLRDAGCLQTALARNSFGRNLTETTSSIAEANNAILAINGDYYGFRSEGYVMRQGYMYRYVPLDDPEQEDLVLSSDGSLQIIREADVTAQHLEENTDATDVFSFGPGLVIDGEISVQAQDEVGRAQATNPRTAIGLIAPLHYVFVVSDGRTDESTGLSLLELAQFMKDLGCTLAYNLDGGGSSTMWFNGQVLNNPTTFGDKIAERKVSDIIYIGRE